MATEEKLISLYSALQFNQPPKTMQGDYKLDVRVPDILAQWNTNELPHQFDYTFSRHFTVFGV